MNKTVLSFLAHPDDAEFLCAGTMLRLAQAGWETHIATCTAGDCGSMTASPWSIMATRTAEAQKAARLMGATYHCLGELDALVVYDKPTLQKAYDLFRRVAPGLVFLHSPVDYMMDHVMSSLVGRAASFIYPAPNVTTVPRHPRSGVPYLYYCSPSEGIDPAGRPVEPTTYVDVSGVMRRKTAMLCAHASQRDWLRAHHGMDEYIDSMKRTGAGLGRAAGVRCAEAFVQHRGHAYPHDDLLAELFPLSAKA